MTKEVVTLDAHHLGRICSLCQRDIPLGEDLAQQLSERRGPQLAGSSFLSPYAAAESFLRQANASSLKRDIHARFSSTLNFKSTSYSELKYNDRQHAPPPSQHPREALRWVWFHFWLCLLFLERPLAAYRRCCCCRQASKWDNRRAAPPRSASVCVTGTEEHVPC